MNSHLVRHLAAVRSALVFTIALGLFSTAALVAQMLMISLIVSRAFLDRTDLPGLWPLLLLLLGASLLDIVQGLPTLLLFGRTEAECERVARVSERFRERTMKVLRMAFLSGLVLEFLTLGAIGVLAVTLGVRLLNGDISLARALFVLLVVPEFYRPLRELGVQRHAGMEGKAALTSIVGRLETPPPVATPAAPSSAATVPAPA